MSEFGKFERRERSTFFLQQMIEAGVTRHVVGCVAGESASPFFSELALDERDQLSSAVGASVSEFFWPDRQELRSVACATGL
jgi:hypothetical protein